MDASALVSLLVYVLILGCIFGLALYLVSILPIPEPFKSWIRIAVIVVAVLVVIFWLLSLVGGGPSLRLR